LLRIELLDGRILMGDEMKAYMAKLPPIGEPKRFGHLGNDKHA